MSYFGLKFLPSHVNLWEMSVLSTIGIGTGGLMDGNALEGRERSLRRIGGVFSVVLLFFFWA